MSFKPFHQHLLVKGKITNPTKSTDVLNQWLIDLVHKVDMEVLAGPNSVYCDHPGNEGITGTIVLSTSHASIHIWDSSTPGDFQFDIYSCKKFSPEDVLEHLNLFGLTEYGYIVVDRNERLSISDSGSGVFHQ
jgi:S-adenosylmethionine/arginine decarboxylase-like enzyme